MMDAGDAGYGLMEYEDPEGAKVPPHTAAKAGEGTNIAHAPTAPSLWRWLRQAYHPWGKPLP